MNFRRTSSGLSNQHLFLNVDTIVFVEGSTSYSKDDVYNGKFTTDSFDIKFWHELFSIFLKKKKVQFRAIGSKSTLKSIAEDIEKGEITNVYVAMDRDFDILNFRHIQTKGVLYTYGYSWENDVWQPEVVQDVFGTIYIGILPGEVAERIFTLYKQFVNDINIAVYADAFLSRFNRSFIPRDKHMRCIKFERDSEPTANIDTIQNLLEKIRFSKEEIQDFGSRYTIDPFSDCYGHLLSDFCYFLISYFLKKVSKSPSMSKDCVISIGIDKFINRLTKRQIPTLNTHYKNYFSSL
ncbi:MAG: DUF4435 domain-containing protein [Candidatus Omnitrophota bacterium]